MYIKVFTGSLEVNDYVCTFLDVRIRMCGYTSKVIAHFYARQKKKNLDSN